MRRELVRRGNCPTCNSDYQRLAQHWSGSCTPPALANEQRKLIAGLLLGDGFVGGSGENKHFQLSTRWRPLVEWLFDELGWLAMKIVRWDHLDDGHPPPAQRYIVRTHAHSALTRFRAWYDAEGNRRFPAPEDLPGGRLTPRSGRAWHATAGGLLWSNPEYATTRQAWFSAAVDERATRVRALLKSVGLEPTRAGKRVQLSPKQTTAWLEWIGDPVPGVEYKWAATHEEYRDLKRDEEGLRVWLWHNPEADALD
ncbi:MAG TPA: hypothetical protein VFJ06_06605 [Halococcus sp.]|nr:hypothetical protein [Halococcus sp.]